MECLTCRWMKEVPIDKIIAYNQCQEEHAEHPGSGGGFDPKNTYYERKTGACGPDGKYWAAADWFDALGMDEIKEMVEKANDRDLS